MRTTIIAAAALTACLTTTPAFAEPVPPVFSYQGYLEDSGSPLTGTADIVVTLIDDLNMDVETDTHLNVTVTDGQFTILLDFNPAHFTGADYDLEFAVRSPAGAGAYTTLFPRTAIVSHPYSYHANTADTLITPATIQGNHPGRALTIDHPGTSSADATLRVNRSASGELFMGFQSRVIEVESQDTSIGLISISTEFPIVGYLNENSTPGNSAAVLGQVASSAPAGHLALWGLNLLSGTQARLGTDDFSADLTGDVRVDGDITRAYAPGSYDLAAPIAYGFVFLDGSIGSGTPNFSATWNAASSRYEIEIDDESYFITDYATAVTPTGFNLSVRTGSSGGRLLVYLSRTTDQTLTQGNFQFVTYKPGGAALIQNQSRPPLTPLSPGTPLDSFNHAPRLAPRNPIKKQPLRDPLQLKP